MHPRHEARLELHACDARAAAAVATAVAVEALDGPGGATVSWSSDGATVVCRIAAADAGSLRAAATGALKLGEAARRCAEA